MNTMKYFYRILNAWWCDIVSNDIMKNPNWFYVAYNNQQIMTVILSAVLAILHRIFWCGSSRGALLNSFRTLTELRRAVSTIVFFASQSRLRVSVTAIECCYFICVSLFPSAHHTFLYVCVNAIPFMGKRAQQPPSSPCVLCRQRDSGTSCCAPSERTGPVP